MRFEKKNILLDTGLQVQAQAPIIVSASRATDIPAFYAEWFFNRLEKGYSVWTNPFNGVRSYVSYQNVRLIVFWSKNPEPLLDYWNILKKKNINFYIQYTLNDYVKEKLENGVPSLTKRIDTFKRLVDKLGFGKVIWRFDPLFLTDTICKDDLLLKVEYIGNQLNGYTEKMVFSYADIQNYRKVKNNLERNNIHYIDFTEDDMNYMAINLNQLNKKWGYTLATCGEKIDLDKYGISHNKCIDDDLMIKYFSDDKILMDFIGAEQNLFGEYTIKKTKKDYGQRLYCGCISSKDIGEYNTCPHLCEYCYANANKEIALANYERIKAINQLSETITGI